MPKKRNGVSRREFIRDAALLSGEPCRRRACPGTVRAQARAGRRAEARRAAHRQARRAGLILDGQAAGEARRGADAGRAGQGRQAAARRAARPEEPLVIKPVHEIGKYGGTWRRGFTGPGDSENGNRIMSADKLAVLGLHRHQAAPDRRQELGVSDGGKTLHLLPAQGHKWSDGPPFTADDFMFWYEDIYPNKDLDPVAARRDVDQRQAGHDREGRRDHRRASSSPSRTRCSWTSSAGITAIGGGQAHGGRRDGFMGALRAGPLPEAVPPEVHRPGEARPRWRRPPASTTGSTCFKFKNNWRSTPSCRCSTPGRRSRPINTPTWTLERNPYFYAVDTEGNQLPYIDKIQMTLAENLEVLNLRAIAGEYD